MPGRGKRNLYLAGEICWRRKKVAQKEAQKEAPPKNEPAALVPVKTDAGSGFLGHLQFELSHLDYTSAGSVSRAELSIRYQPLEVGVSVGALDLDYNRQALFFVTPRASLEYPGEHVELYMDASSAIVLGGGQVQTTAFPYITAGAVVEPLKPGENRGFGLQLGFEAQATLEERDISAPKQFLVTAETGVALTFKPLTVYGTEQVFFESEKPYDAPDARLLKPKHGKVGGGLVLHLEGAEFGFEMGWGPIEREAKFDFGVDAKHVQPTISVYGKRRSYGLGDEFGISLSLDFGEKRKVGTVRVEQAFGDKGKGWEDATYTDTYTLAERQSAESGTPADAEIQRASEQIIPPSEERAGYEFFIDAVRNSRNLDEFVDKYKGASFTQKIFAAWELLYHGGINFKILSDAGIEALAVGGAYGAIRNYVLTGKKGEAGDCVNLGSLAGEFLRRSGIDAYGAGIFDTQDGHMMTIVRGPGGESNYLMDMYGITEFKGDNVWPALQAYAARRGLLLHQIRIYGDGNKIVGIYNGPEGNLIEEAAAQRERKGLGRRFIKRRESD